MAQVEHRSAPADAVADPFQGFGHCRLLHSGHVRLRHGLKYEKPLAICKGGPVVDAAPDFLD
jgi:hypothetical protein